MPSRQKIIKYFTIFKDLKQKRREDFSSPSTNLPSSSNPISLPRIPQMKPSSASVLSSMNSKNLDNISTTHMVGSTCRTSIRIEPHLVSNQTQSSKSSAPSTLSPPFLQSASENHTLTSSGNVDHPVRTIPEINKDISQSNSSRLDPIPLENQNQIPSNKKCMTHEASNIINQLHTMLINYQKECNLHGGLPPDGEHMRHIVWKHCALVLDNPKCIELLNLDLCRRMLTATASLRVTRLEDRIRRILNVCKQKGFRLGRMGYHRLMRSVVNKSDGQEFCRKLIQEMKQAGLYPNQKTYVIYLEALLNNTDLKTGEQWVENSVGKLSVSKDAHYQSDDKKRNLTTFERDISVYDALMGTCYIKGHYDKVFELAENARQSCLKLSLRTHLILLKSYIKQNDMRGADVQLKSMLAAGLVRNCVPHDAMIEGWLSLLISRKKSSSNHHNIASCSISVDTRLFPLPNAFNGNNNPSNDFGSIEQLNLPFGKSNRALHIGEATNTLAIDGTAKDDDYHLQQARMVYQDMIATGITPGVHTYFIFMNAHLRKHQYREVLVLYKDLIEKNLHPSIVVFTTVMTAAIAMNDYEMVEELFQQARQIDDGWLDLHIYTTYLSSLAKSGETDRVEQVFQQMLRDGLVPNLFTWDVLLHSKCVVGDIFSATDVVSRMEAHGLPQTPRISNMLIYAHCKVGDLKAASQRFLQMKTSGLQPDLMTFNTLIWGHYHMGDEEGAMKWYTGLLAAGLEPNTPTFNILIAANARRLDAIRAMDDFQKLLSKNMKPDIYSLIPLLDVHARRGNVRLVNDGLNLLRKNDLPATAPFNILLEFKSRNRDLKGLLEYYQSATQNDAESKNITPDVRTFDIIVRAFAAAGNKVDAQRWFDETRKFNIKPDTRLYNGLIKAYVRSADFRGARRVFNEMRSKGISPDSMTSFLLPKESNLDPEI